LLSHLSGGSDKRCLYYHYNCCR